MIPAWREVLDRAAGMLAPGGSLHVVDFGPCEGLSGMGRAALYAWLARFSVTPRQDLAAVLATTATKHELDRFYDTLYRGYAAYGVLTRR